MPAKKSILFLTYHFPPEVGGIQTRISKYIDRLAKRGILVTVVVAGHSVRKLAVPMAAKIVPCPGGMRRLPENAVSVTMNIVRSRADVVHVFTGCSTLLGVYSLVVAKLVGAKPVVSFFGREDFELTGRSSRTLLRIATKIAESIDVNSSATKALLPENVRGKVHVLLGAAEGSDLSASRGLPSTPNVLFVGRLVERKGVDDLLRAFAIVSKQFPDATLTVVGNGPEMNNLIGMAGLLGISGHVSFKGTLVGPVLQEEYEACSLFVLPSKDVPSDPANEGLGLALIEASMHSKPLVGTLHGGIPEVIRAGDNGLLVPPADPTALAQAISTILANRELAQGMGQAALKNALARFSWDHATDVLLESYA